MINRIASLALMYVLAALMLAPQVVSAAPSPTRNGPVVRVRGMTTGNVNLATTELTPIDGLTPASGDLWLVKSQSTGSQNGIYFVGQTCTADGDGGTVCAYPWVRVSNSQGGSPVKAGLIVSVAAGTTGAGTLWVCSNTSDPTIGSTSVTFANIVPGVPYKVALTAGTETAHAIVVSGQLKDMAGVSVSTTTQVMIHTLCVTADKGDITTATAGTLVKAVNPSTGENVAWYTTTSGGAFDLTVTDSVAESCTVSVTGERMLTSQLNLTFGG